MSPHHHHHRTPNSHNAVSLSELLLSPLQSERRRSTASPTPNRTSSYRDENLRRNSEMSRNQQHSPKQTTYFDYFDIQRRSRSREGGQLEKIIEKNTKRFEDL